MFVQIQALLKPPVFDDPEKSRAAALLYILTTRGLILLLIFLPVLLLAADETQRPRILIELGLLPLVFGFAVMIRRGYVKTTAWVLIAAVWLTNTAVLVTSGGVRVMTVGYFVLLVLVPFLLSRRESIAITFFTITSLLLLAIVETQNSAPGELSPPTPLSAWLVQTVGLLSIFILVSFASRQVIRSERRLRSVFDEGFIGLAVVDNEGNCISVSRRLREMLGAGDAPLRGSSILQFIFLDDGYNLRQVFTRLNNNTQATYQDEFLLVRSDESTFWASVSCTVVDEGDEKHIIMMVQDIDEHKQYEESLEFANHFQGLITTLSTQFINLRTDEIDGGIAAVQQLVADFVDADYSRVWVISDEGTTMQARHLWHKPGVDVSRLQVDSEGVGMLMGWFTQAIQDQGHVHVPDVDAMPPEAAEHQHILHKMGVRSSIVIALRQQNKDLIGFMSFNSTHDARFWSGSTIQLLQVVGEIVVNAIERQRTEIVLRQNQETTTDFQRKLVALHEISMELANVDSLEELYRRGVELGLQRLGFDRLGLLLIDGDTILTTFGTDQEGKLRDERGLSRKIADDPRMAECITGKKRMYLWKDTELVDAWEPVGRGWNAAAMLWNGDESIGWLATDNLLSQQPPMPAQLELLTLYGATLGHLITLKRANEALQQLEARNRLMLDASPVAILVGRISDHRIQYINPAGVDLLGAQNAEQILDTSVMDYLSPTGQALALNRLKNLQEVQKLGTIEYRVHRLDGQVIDVEVASIMIEFQGEPAALRVVNNVTERKAAARALVESEVKFRSLVEQSPAGILIFDANHRITYANPEFCHLLQYTLEEALTLSWHDIVVSQTVSDDPTGSHEIKLRRKDGEIRLCEMRFSEVEDDKGLTHTMGQVIDITDREAAENQRLELALEREKVEMLRSFISNISHDVKTPLTTIQTSLYLMTKNNDPAYHENKLNNIREQSDRLNTLIQNLLTISRLDYMPELEFHPVNVNMLIRNAERFVRPAIDQKGLRLTLDLQADLPAIKADEQELQRVVVNLIENAANYTPEGGTLTVSTSQDQRGVLIKVIDTGIGIEADALPHIFERFYRADEARSTVTGGSGLGLAIVKQIVELHKGRVEVASTVGIGTTFTVCLPQVQPELLA